METYKERRPIFFKRWWSAFRSIDWSNPLNKWKAIFFCTIALAVIGGFSVTAILVTDTTWFCGTCHEMSPEMATTDASAHKEAKCIDCHIAPGPYYEHLFHKVKSLKEVYYHVTGIPNPIFQHYEPVVNESCLRCHSVNRIVTESGDINSYHAGHIEAGVYCINCHSGVAHGKIVERGLNTHDTYDLWKEEPEIADLLITDYDRKTNMGTCIECHMFVNEGKTPFSDIRYATPSMTESRGSEPAQMIYENVDPVTGEKVTQDLILQSLGKGGENQNISMACQTCHNEINTPKDHLAKDWGFNHGVSATKDVQSCVDCHKDSLWERRLPWLGMEKSLELSQAVRGEKVTTPAVVKETARGNTFCNTCHEDRPKSHEADGWLIVHAESSKTEKQKAGCFVCHDNVKPAEDEKITAPTDVYCGYCHRTGFKNEK